MRPAQTTPIALVLVLAVTGLAGCEGCGRPSPISQKDRDQLLASAIAAPKPAAPAALPASESIGHAANVIPGQGPGRVPHEAPRLGPALPILPGQGVGAIRFGANRQTIERLMGAPCDDQSDTLCRYVGQALDFKLQGGLTTEIRVSRKGRGAKQRADGAVIEYGFFNGALLPDLYFGMLPSAIQEVLGPPAKVEKIEPMGADGFAERHVYDGATLEYDRWSNGNLVLGAVVLTKSATAAAASEKAEAERAERDQARLEAARKVRPREPR
jgi:hypothetical protein